MAVGEWVDNRATFFFQKIALSADVDSLAENDHRLLVQAGMYHTTQYDAEHPEYEITTRTLEYSAASPPSEWIHIFSLQVWDRCPWNRLRITTWIQTLTTPGNISVRLRRSPTDGGPDDATLVDIIFDTATALGLVAGAWNEWAVFDITTLAEGTYVFEFEWVCAVGAAFSIGPTNVTLESTVSGHVA